MRSLSPSITRSRQASARHATAQARPAPASTVVITLLALATSAWLVVSPWALAYPTGDPRTDAFLNQALVGMTLGITAVAFQAAEGAVRRMPAVTVLAGAWLVVVPHLQGFRDSATANCTVAGSVTVALGVLMCLAGPRLRRG